MTRSRIDEQKEHPESQASNGVASGNGDASGTAHQNGTTAPAGDGGTKESAVTDPIAAAEAVQDSLRTALSNTNRMIQVLRRNRKQARLVETTLASLRELQSVS